MHLEDHTLPCVLYRHGEIDEVVLDSIAIAASYWRIAYRYLEMVILQTSTLPCNLEDHTLPCVLYHHGEIDEVVPDSIARADSYWRIDVPGNGDPADFHNTVHLEATRFPVFVPPRGNR